MSVIRLSFIICSYNRSAYVRRLLLTLLAQAEAFADIEIIVVDNNSNDDTKEVVTSFSNNHSFIHYVFERQQGLSNARNRGAAEANGKHLLFLDDDALVPNGFAEEMHRVITTHDPDFFGGPIYPIYADHIPTHFPEYLEVRKKAPKTGFHRDVTMSGGNFGVRKSTLEQLGGFNPLYGMTGNKVGMLEERLLVDAYKELTPIKIQRLYYTLEGYLFHHTPLQRMTYEFQRKRIYVADYQMSRHLLAQGLRSPGMFFRAARQRFFFVLNERLLTLISPKPSGATRFKSRIQVWRAWAALYACITHNVANTLGRLPKRKASPHPEAALRLLWLVMPERGSTARDMSRESKDHQLLDEVFQHTPVNVERIFFDKPPKNKELNARIIAASPNAFDAILFEQELPEGTAKISRAHHPHLQYLVRLNRTKLMTLLDNMDTRPGRLRALKRNWPAIKKAIAKDRASVRYADLVIHSSHWERRLYLGLFGQRKKFAYIPPAPPFRIVKKATEAKRQSVKRDWLTVVGDIAPSHFDSRQAYRAIEYFNKARSTSKSLKNFKVIHCGKKLEVKMMRTTAEATYSGVLGCKDYYGLLAKSRGVLFGEDFRSGHPTRFAEAAFCGTPLVLPKRAWKKLDPHLQPLAEPYQPSDSKSLAAAIERAQNNVPRNWDRASKMRKASLKAWADIITECRLWMRPHGNLKVELDAKQPIKLQTLEERS